MSPEMKEVFVKIILTLENDHHGCKEEAINIAKTALGVKIEHNTIREMINNLDEKHIQDVMTKII